MTLQEGVVALRPKVPQATVRRLTGAALQAAGGTYHCSMLTSYPLLLSGFGWRPAGVMLAAVMVFISPPHGWGADLDAYQWKNRLLLIMAPSDTDPRVVGFESRLAARRDDIRDRDLLTLRLLEAGPSVQPDQTLSPESVQALRRRYGAAPGRFLVILIGKDGGVKLVQEEQVSLQAIFDLIDTMPMRRREMRLRGDADRGGDGG